MMAVTGDFRQKARDEVARLWPGITKALEDAIAAETTKYGDCPRCKKRVPVEFPDIQGRVKAMKFLIEAAHGKPSQTIDMTVGLESDLDRWGGYLDRMTEEERKVMHGFLVRESELQAPPIGDKRNAGLPRLQLDNGR
jgi:hypothetical protein